MIIIGEKKKDRLVDLRIFQHAFEEKKTLSLVSVIEKIQRRKNKIHNKFVVTH
jgi:hypothetical protein